MKKYSLSLLSFFLLLGLTYSAVRAQKNVLFLMADDFNYWMTGYYPALKTPNLDSLASMGIMFTEAHCTSPVCIQSA